MEQEAWGISMERRYGRMMRYLHIKNNSNNFRNLLDIMIIYLFANDTVFRTLQLKRFTQKWIKWLSQTFPVRSEGRNSKSCNNNVRSTYYFFYLIAFPEWLFIVNCIIDYTIGKDIYRPTCYIFHTLHGVLLF